MRRPCTVDLAIYRLIQTPRHTPLHDISLTISLLLIRISIIVVLLFLDGHSDRIVRKVDCSETMWIPIMGLRIPSQHQPSAQCCLANLLRLPRHSKNKDHHDRQSRYQAIDKNILRRRLPSTRTRQMRLLLDNTTRVRDLIRLRDLRKLLRQSRGRQGLVRRQLSHAKPRVSWQRQLRGANWTTVCFRRATIRVAEPMAIRDAA